MAQQFRTTSGGQIDRRRTISFTFDGKSYQGYEGDTLASALLANGVHLLGRSFKYHRPRGILTAGSEEPNAIVELRAGPRKEPNTRATTIELFDGLVANSQNRWPSLAFDVMSINGLFSPLLSAGFYYKTFMWPVSFWTNVYEHVIRRAAGLGSAPTEADPDHYEQCHEHCDVLVVGAGAAGLSAALAAAQTDARVILVDEHRLLGGSLNSENFTVDGKAGSEWAAEAAARLAAMDNVHILNRSTVFGYYDHNVIGAVEKVSDHLPVPPRGHPRQRMWLLYPQRVVLATGATERPLVFGNNDKPGVMLASAVRSYINAYGVKPGKRVLVTTNNNDAYRTAIDLHRAGAFVAAVVDSRAHPESPLVEELKKLSIRLITGSTVGAAEGGKRVKRAQIVSTLGDTLDPESIDCDLIACSGGWNPNVHLHSQSGAKPVYDDSILSFVPGESRQAETSAGAAAGSFALQDCLTEGHNAGHEAAKLAGFKGRKGKAAKADDEGAYAIEALWISPTPYNKAYKQFVDQQNDVKASDVQLASQEGYDSVELLKRYTTQGMATDQGKTSNVNALAILACQRGEPIPEVGITTFRPPYVPVAMGVFAGHGVGADFMPVRRTAIHDWNEKQGAVFIEAGLWMRARYFPQKPGDTMYDCYVRETEATRNNVALVDVTTLGKIDIQGPDAPEFLNRLYINNWLKLPVGKARYGIMLREDGMVYDDGTTSRLGENHFFMTTTTANAAGVLAHMEQYHQTEWPELDVVFCSVTEQWTGIAVAGPNSRKLLEKVIDIDISNDAFPFMGVGECRLNNIPARLFRISFSGELAYEVNVPADYGEQAWLELLEAGKEMGVGVYGTEALGTMRIEKGHVAGSELDGRTTAKDLGLEGMANRSKHFIGKHNSERPVLEGEGRLQVVGLKSIEPDRNLRIGAHLVDPNTRLDSVSQSQGHVSATTYSPQLGCGIALGLLKDGASRHGEQLEAVFPLDDEKLKVEVCHPVFIDPEGELVRA
ncbi:MAG: sarcosine oxidase subunit alpha family protein [Gammaproteobacteria bacterium]|nr:sarcosine oxidase subunit alpha family protein [Gammaproteobacteria bacterium]